MGLERDSDGSDDAVPWRGAKPPLKPVVGRPARSSFDPTGKEVDNGAEGKKHPRLGPNSECLYPLFLAGFAQPHDEDGGLGCSDVFGESARSARFEKILTTRRPEAAHLERRPSISQHHAQRPVRFRSAAEKAHSPSKLNSQVQDRIDQVAAGQARPVNTRHPLRTPGQRDAVDEGHPMQALSRAAGWVRAQRCGTALQPTPIVGEMVNMVQIGRDKSELFSGPAVRVMRNHVHRCGFVDKIQRNPAGNHPWPRSIRGSLMLECGHDFDLSCQTRTTAGEAACGTRTLGSPVPSAGTCQMS